MTHAACSQHGFHESGSVAMLVGAMVAWHPPPRMQALLIGRNVLVVLTVANFLQHTLQLLIISNPG